MKKLSIIVKKLNICQVSGWNEKRGSEIRLEFYTDAQAGGTQVPSVNLHHRAEWSPSPIYLHVGSSEYGPKATFGSGSYSHCALEALTTGLDLGSITYFSTRSIRSYRSRAVAVSNTACCSRRRGGWAAGLTKLKDSGMAIPFRVVHQLNSMRLLSKTSLLLFQETLERQREVIDHSALQHLETLSHQQIAHTP